MDRDYHLMMVIKNVRRENRTFEYLRNNSCKTWICWKYSNGNYLLSNLQ